MATLKDIAKEAKVSLATASYVLNGTRTFSPETMQRVHEAAERLGYMPNRIARTLRSGRSETLALLLPDIANPFFPLLAQKIEDAAEARGFALLFFDSHGDPEREAEAVMRIAEYQAEGVIWIPSSGREAVGVDRPLVVVDRPLPGHDNVYADHNRGGELQAVYALRQGHTRIMLLSGPQHLPGLRARRESFVRKVHGEAELREVEVPLSVDLPQAALETMIDFAPTIVVAASDIIAIGVLKALKSLGISVPGDVSVLGYDDIPWASLVQPELTTVRQPVDELAVQAVELLLRRVEGAGGSPEEITVDVSLVERASVRRLA